MRIKWGIEDGYVGKARPHYVEIPDKEFEDCETKDEIDEVIEGWIKTEFENKIYYYWEREQ